MKWLLVVYGFCFSSLEDLLQTISPETATNENFHPMHCNLKTLMGRNQAEYFMIFVFFSRSSILFFFFNWKWGGDASTFCDCGDVQEALLA